MTRSNALRVLALAVTVVVVLAIAGCGGIKAGTVTARQYSPAHSETQYMPITIGTTCAGSVCTPLTTLMPYDVWVSDAWYLDLRDGENTGTVSVTRAVFDAAAVGSHYPPTVVHP